jgi:hypothetical protein
MITLTYKGCDIASPSVRSQWYSHCDVVSTHGGGGAGWHVISHVETPINKPVPLTVSQHFFSTVTGFRSPRLNLPTESANDVITSEIISNLCYIWEPCWNTTITSLCVWIMMTVIWRIWISRDLSALGLVTILLLDCHQLPFGWMTNDCLGTAFIVLHRRWRHETRIWYAEYSLIILGHIVLAFPCKLQVLNLVT